MPTFELKITGTEEELFAAMHATQVVAVLQKVDEELRTILDKNNALSYNIREQLFNIRKRILTMGEVK